MSARKVQALWRNLRNVDIVKHYLYASQRFPFTYRDGNHPGVELHAALVAFIDSFIPFNTIEPIPFVKALYNLVNSDIPSELLSKLTSV